MFEREPNIDIVFRNGLKDLEVLPPAGVWETIPPVTLKRRRFSSVAMTAAGVATLMVLSLLATWYARTSTPRLRTQMAALIDESNAIVRADLIKSALIIHGSPESILSSAEPGPRFSVHESPIAHNTDPTLPNIAKNDSHTLKEDIGTAAGEKEGDVWVLFPDMTLSVYDPDPELTLTPKSRPAGRRFSMGAAVSPAFGVVSAGNSERAGELLSNEESVASYSTGVTFSYKLTPRFSIQSGIGVSSVGQLIEDVNVYAGLSDYYAAKGDYLYSVETASGTILSTNTDLFLADGRNRVSSFTLGGLADVSKYRLDYVSGDIKQVFRYLEVPLVIRYKVVDRNVDMNISGGMAYGLLVSNVAFASNGSENVRIGRTEGVNLHSLSSQLGLGMEYNISGNIAFNVEPVFRYYLTPFSDLSSSISRPYSFGVFSGLSVRF